MLCCTSRAHAEIFVAIVPVPCFFFTGVACVLEYTRVSSVCIHLLMCSVSFLVGANTRMWISFWHCPFRKHVHTRSSDFPDGLVPLGPFPLRSPFPSPFECHLFRTEERDLLLFPFPFLFTSCLKLHQPPREHCSFEVQ